MSAPGGTKKRGVSARSKFSTPGLGMPQSRQAFPMLAEEGFACYLNPSVPRAFALSNQHGLAAPVFPLP